MFHNELNLLFFWGGYQIWAAVTDSEVVYGLHGFCNGIHTVFSIQTNTLTLWLLVQPESFQDTQLSPYI